MNFEASRLRTFHKWPSNAVIDAKRIAKAGFYYTGQGQEVQCFSCGGKITEWNYGDQVMTRHRWLDPRCPFVLNPIGSGNVSIEADSPQGINLEDSSSSTASSSTSNQDTDFTPIPYTPIPQSATGSRINNSRRSPTLHAEFRNELVRLNTFENWPKTFIVTPESLARAGFFYTNEDDTVKCAFCGIMVEQWEEGDDPYIEHLKHQPDCNFLNNPSNYYENYLPAAESDLIIHHPVVDVRTPGITEKDIGIHGLLTAKNPKYANRDARIQSFNSWPGGPVQPKDLVEAGFFYTGDEDTVQCFNCDCQLMNWISNDDAWTEHARWKPKCSFVLLSKGQAFVDKVLKDHWTENNEEVCNMMPNLNYREENKRFPVRFQVPEEDVENVLLSREALGALELGMDVSRVKAAIRDRLNRARGPFPTTEALINAALDVQINQLRNSDHTESWMTPPRRSRLNRTVRRLHEHEGTISETPPEEAMYNRNSSEENDENEFQVIVDSDLISTRMNRLERRYLDEGTVSETSSEAMSNGNSTEEDNELIKNRSTNVLEEALPVYNMNVYLSNESTDNNDNVMEESNPFYNTAHNSKKFDYYDDNLHQPSVSADEIKNLMEELKIVKEENKNSKEEIRRLKESRICKICMDEEVSVVLLPCGHLVTCVCCAHSIENCPVCRNCIKASVRIFLS